MARARQRVEAADTASRILDVAERLVQTRGFNGFSYADIAAELKISKPSLHYHFPSKAALGEALIGRYAARFTEALQASLGVDVHPAAVALADESLAGRVSTHRLAVAAGLAAAEVPQ